MYEGTRHMIIGRATVPAGTESIQSWETACNSTLYRTDAEQRVEVHALVKEDAAGLTIVEQAHIHFDASKVSETYTNRVFSSSSHHHNEFAPGECVEERGKRATYSFQVERFLADLTDFEPTVEFAFISHAYLWEGELKATPCVAVALIDEPDDDCFGHDGSAPGPVRTIGSRLGNL